MKKLLLIGLVILLLAGMTGCSKEETVKIEEHDWNLTFVLSSDDGSRTPILIISMDGYDLNFQSEELE